MKPNRSLRQSLLSSHILVSLVPLSIIALFILHFFIKNVREEFMIRIDLMAKGIRGQIQLFMEQPLANLGTIATLLTDPEIRDNSKEITRILNTHVGDSLYFESIQLLNASGVVINTGLPPEKERFRAEMLGIDLGHKKEFRQAQKSGDPVWSDTFLSLSSGKISLSLYFPSGTMVLAADINLNTLAQFIAELGSEKVVTMVIDRNGAIIFHPDPNLVGKSIMVNTIDLVPDALAGKERIGQFTFQGISYLGATSTLSPTGWVALIAEPSDRFFSLLFIPLLIIGSGLLTAVIFSMALAYFRAKKVAQPLMEITAKSSIIAQGDYSTPLPVNTIVELQQLADSINHMAEAIQKREAELRDKELKYRELVEHTSNLVLRLDHRLSITYANHTLPRLADIPAEKAIGVSFPELVEAEDREKLTDQIRTWVSAGLASETAECRFMGSQGEPSYLLLTFNIHYDSSGSLSDIGIIGHDITVRYQIERQQQEMERQRQQSQKMELLGLVAGGVAHDLNNILAGIINYPELMLLKLEEDSPLRPSLEAVKKSGERAAAVVADLLTVARNSATVYTTVDLNDLITSHLNSPEFAKVCDHHPHVDCTFHPGKDLWPCTCSPIHIEKTLMNLVINGFEAIGERGQVQITTRNISAESLPEDARNLQSRPYVAFTVQDSGQGISESDKQRIFEPFFSKKRLGRSGTGLGLTVAWNTVREHGGDILVKSGSAGTLFTVLLPAAEDNDGQPETLDTTIQLRGHGENILVVDDEQTLREIAVHMLEMLGYQATAVKSGEDALAFLNHHKVDLILLDMQMDPGMSGRETYRKIKAIHPRQKALIATGFSTSNDVTATLEDGAGGFIKKPYNLINLSRAVYDILHQVRE